MKLLRALSILDKERPYLERLELEIFKLRFADHVLEKIRFVDLTFERSGYRSGTRAAGIFVRADDHALAVLGAFDGFYDDMRIRGYEIGGYIDFVFGDKGSVVIEIAVALHFRFVIVAPMRTERVANGVHTFVRVRRGEHRASQKVERNEPLLHSVAVLAVGEHAYAPAAVAQIYPLMGAYLELRFLHLRIV